MIIITTLAATAAISAAVLLAPLATADTGTDYGDTHAWAVCSTLEQYPSVGGIAGVAEGMHELSDLTYDQTIEAIEEAIHTQCPRFTGLIEAFTHAETTQA